MLPASQDGKGAVAAYGLAARLKRKTVVAFVDRENIEINFWGQPSIERQLSLTKVMPLFERAKIEKAKIEGLLYFINKWRRDEHPRDVGFDAMNFMRPMRIGPTRFKKCDEAFLVRSRQPLA